MTRPALQPPDDLADWSLHCFCINARSTPHAVIHLDNNGRILFHAGNGVTFSALRERGIPCSESQAALLATYGLVDRKGDTLTARFPILGPSEAADLRMHAGAIAQQILPDVVEPAGRIVDRLRSAGMAANGRAVVFGYALDGLAWEALRARRLLPSTQLTIERPFWNGTFWAVYPPRSEAAGVNEVREDGVALSMMWTDAVATPLAALGRRPEMRPFLRALRHTRAESASMAGLIGEDRAIPVIRPVPSSTIHAASESIAAAVSAAIPDGHHCRSILAEAGVDARTEDAAVILTHEAIWEVMELLDKKAVFGRLPAEPSELTPYLFVRTGESEG